jgi:hypothetical protein
MDTRRLSIHLDLLSNAADMSSSDFSNRTNMIPGLQGIFARQAKYITDGDQGMRNFVNGDYQKIDECLLRSLLLLLLIDL